MKAATLRSPPIQAPAIIAPLSFASSEKMLIYKKNYLTTLNEEERIFSSVPDKFLPVTLLRLSVSAFYFQNIPTVEELFLIRCYVIKLFSTEI